MCSKDPNKNLSLLKKIDEVEIKERKNLNIRLFQKDKMNLMQFCGYARMAELTDGQISKLVGSTKGTVSLIKKKKLLEFSNLKPRDPVILSLCTQRLSKKV